MAFLTKIPQWNDLRRWMNRRVLVVDPGTHCLKLLLVHIALGRPELERFEMLDLEEEGLLTPEELGRHVDSLVREMGSPPIVLLLSQQFALSQLIDLPSAPEDEVGALIEAETVKMAGLSESPIVYDYSPIQRLDGTAYWLTLCQESEITGQLSRLALPRHSLFDVTTTSNALAAAYLSAQPDADRVILIELGGAITAVALLCAGRIVYANSFAAGSDVFTEAIAAESAVSFQAAERLKRGEPLLVGSQPSLRLCAAVDSWIEDIERIVQEWLQEHPEAGADLSGFKFILAGGGALQPGLPAYLSRRTGRIHQLWHEPLLPDESVPAVRVAAAWGAALHALEFAPQRASLLPADLREDQRKERTIRKLHAASWVLLLVAALALLFGSVRNIQLIDQKRQLLDTARLALEKAASAEAVSARMAVAYQNVRPVVERQEWTLDTLRALAALEKAKTNDNFFTVVFADHVSYFLGDLAGSPATNAAAGGEAALPAPPFSRGFVAEIVVPGESEAVRRTLSEIVTRLKEEPPFANVDSLPMDLRRPWASTNVTLSGRHFALALELPPSSASTNRTRAPALAAPSPVPVAGRTFQEKAGEILGNSGRSP